MDASKPTVEELADELASAYGLIMYALPLALRALTVGSVPLAQQYAFWNAVHQVERKHLDLFFDFEGVNLDDLSGVFCETAGPNPIPEIALRIEELQTLDRGG